jgi:Uri superfamily endonuclease
VIVALILLGMAVALGAGIYVGLGAPGTRGRENRVVYHRPARRLEKRHIDWLRPKR